MLIRKLVMTSCLMAGVLAAAASAEERGVAAVVNGQKITTAELDERALGTNMKLAQSLYDARKSVLDDLIMERLLAEEAKSKGVSAEDLLDEKINAKATPVTDDDVQRYYDANKARIKNRTLEQVAGQIRTYLENQNRTAAKATVLAELKAGAGVSVLLDAPRAIVKVADNDPYKGGKDAKVTVVEFSDFQ